MERLVQGPVYPDVAVITLADVVEISRMPCMTRLKLSYLKNVLEVSTSMLIQTRLFRSNRQTNGCYQIYYLTVVQSIITPYLLL